MTLIVTCHIRSHLPHDTVKDSLLMSYCLFVENSPSQQHRETRVSLSLFAGAERGRRYLSRDVCLAPPCLLGHVLEQYKAVMVSNSMYSPVLNRFPDRAEADLVMDDNTVATSSPKRVGRGLWRAHPLSLASASILFSFCVLRSEVHHSMVSRTSFLLLPPSP